MIRQTLRRLRKNLGFTVTVAVTLGLGIGATASIFSLVHAVLLRPLPFPEPARLMWLQKAERGASEPLSYPDYFDWRARSRLFDSMACWRGASLSLTGSGAAQQLQAATVSANFFRTLGVQPAIGRDFLAEEEEPGARVVMLSHGLWQSTFGARRDIAGASVTLEGQPYEAGHEVRPG